jgi:signal peptide peptidase SppA
MNLPQILSTLKSEPLFCSSGYRETLLEIFTSHAALSAADYKHSRTGKAKSGSELEIQDMEIVNGLALLPIGGPIGQNLGEFEKGAGCVDVDDICAELDQAEEDDSAESIVLMCDTPGGMVMGTPECGQRILAVEKPIYAWTRGQMCSAGYWLASCTDGIFCTPTAQVGSIGVCSSFMDLSKMADMQGIKVKSFGSGDYKGMGTPGTSLTAKQELFLQNRVMTLAQQFYDHVRAQRGNISADDMQGQTFSGADAVAKGLADGLMNNFEELASFLTAK